MASLSACRTRSSAWLHAHAVTCGRLRKQAGSVYDARRRPTQEVRIERDLERRGRHELRVVHAVRVLCCIGRPARSSARRANEVFRSLAEKEVVMLRTAAESPRLQIPAAVPAAADSVCPQSQRGTLAKPHPKCVSAADDNRTRSDPHSSRACSRTAPAVSRLPGGGNERQSGS